jgi:type I restriction enzyme, S subunit
MSPEALRVALPDKTAGASPRPGGPPAGWCLSTLGEVASINPSTAFDSFANDAEMPFIPMAAVAEETGIIDASRPRSVAEIRKGYVRFCEGDVIFAKIMPCMENGKTAPVIGIPGGYAAGSTEFHVLRPRAVDTRYLWYWLVRQAFRHEAERNMSGSAGHLRVPVDYLRNSPISVAPLLKQRRIVARIHELFAGIAEGEAALERARQGLDTWRRALLKAAVTGELTRDWREANRPAETGAISSPASVPTGALNPDRSRRRRAAAAGMLDTSDLPELPDGWAWARLDALGEIVGGVTVDKKRAPADPVQVPYLRVANVQRGYLDLTEVRTIRMGREVARRLELKPNDVLLNEGGDRDKIGRGWVWQDELPVCIHQNHIFRVRLHDKGINAEFTSHYTNELGRAFFIEKGKQTTNLASISLSKISELPVPVPPPTEVQIIVGRLREAFATDADNSRDLTEAEALSSALRQSVLKSAFEGHLVPQDPADEPASVLLARLRNSHPGNGARRRRARAAADFSHPSLPGPTQPVDPRVEAAGDE